jgi:hypothetical protein
MLRAGNAHYEADWKAASQCTCTHRKARTLLFSLCIRGMQASGSTAASCAASPLPSPPLSVRDAMYLRCSSSNALRCASALASFSAASFPFAVVGAGEDEVAVDWLEELLLPKVAGRAELAAVAGAATAAGAGAGAGAGNRPFCGSFSLAGLPELALGGGFASFFSHGFVGEEPPPVVVMVESSAGAAAERAGERAGAGAGTDATGSFFRLSMNRRCSASNSACCTSRSLRFCSANANFLAF